MTRVYFDAYVCTAKTLSFSLSLSGDSKKPTTDRKLGELGLRLSRK